jgi:hypothetical protein
MTLTLFSERYFPSSNLLHFLKGWDQVQDSSSIHGASLGGKSDAWLTQQEMKVNSQPQAREVFGAVVKIQSISTRRCHVQKIESLY